MTLPSDTCYYATNAIMRHMLIYKPYRSSLAKLRLSAHSLHIETGRYVKKEEKLTPENRKCKLCTANTCENEYHFIMQCNLYKKERTELFKKTKELFPHTNDYSEITLYKWLMSSLDENIMLHLGKYTYACFMIRSKSLSSTALLQ